jgi:hypothetical protein
VKQPEQIKTEVTQTVRTVVSDKWIFLTSSVLDTTAQPAVKGNSNDNRKQS